MSYITIRDLTVGADFGAQMGAVSGLYSVALKTGHIPVIINEKRNEGYKLRITKDIFPFFYNTFQEVDYMQNKWEWKDMRTDVLMDESVYDLDINKNYNFPVGFMTHYYWEGLEDRIRLLFQFSPDIIEMSTYFVNAIKAWANGKEIVGVHFRRGDYLRVSSLNLSLNYYNEAIKQFDPSKHCLLLFSNSNEDVKWAEANFKPQGFEVYLTDHKYPKQLDMCVMSLCDHMIIANSSYSWWGAFLNKKPNKKIVCPFNYLNVTSLNHVNGNWFRKEWTALKTI